MAGSKERNRNGIREWLLAVATIVGSILLLIFMFNDMYSCTLRSGQEYAAEQEAERIRETHTDVSADPAKMAPARSFPYVIADDDLCKIVLTGQPVFSDDFVTGYERLRSYEGDVIEFEVTNKSDKVAISVGQGGDWRADGRHSLSGELVSETDMPVTYSGPINDIEPGKTLDSDFSVFNQEHGSLDYIDALYGLFEICDKDGHTLALYPFSWEGFDKVTAHELPATFVDDDACSFSVTDLEWDDEAGCWTLGYELRNKTGKPVHLENADGFLCHIEGVSHDLSVRFGDDAGTQSPSAKPDGGTAKGRMSLAYADGEAGEPATETTDQDEMPRYVWGTLLLVTDDASEDADGDGTIAYLPFTISLPDPDAHTIKE